MTRTLVIAAESGVLRFRPKHRLITWVTTHTLKIFVEFKLRHLQTVYLVAVIYPKE